MACRRSVARAEVEKSEDADQSGEETSENFASHPPPDQHYCVAKSPVGRLMPCVYVRRRRQLDAVEERPLTNGRANPAHVVGAPQQRGGREVPHALTICGRSTIRMGILDGNSCMSVHLHEGSRGEQSAVLFGGGGAGRCYLSSTVIRSRQWDVEASLSAR